jgi:pimeloyl-ACP methyl ester carboxylesterase
MIFSALRVYATRQSKRRPAMKQASNETISTDGTRIAYDRSGDGPAVVLVVGAFNDRNTGAPLAAFLASHFSVFSYDRRGRGGSGDAAQYQVQREVEDLDAVIQAAGGSASVFGYSSGAALALKAAAAGLSIPKLALYELPPAQSADHAVELAARIAAGRRGDAVEYFQRSIVGIPEHVITQLRDAPFRPGLEAMAHTLVYDAMIMSDVDLRGARVTSIHQPTLAIAGGASPQFMHDVAAALARLLPNGRSTTLEGATHEIVAAVLGPVLQRWLQGTG